MKVVPVGVKRSVKQGAPVTAPLGFFVLALLIVETFLGAALVGGHLEGPSQITVLWMGVWMFVLVIGVVGVLVWQKPENLTFDKQAHLDRTKAEHGSDDQMVGEQDLMPRTETPRLIE